MNKRMTNKDLRTIAIVGGGAAGYFCAINLAEKLPQARIVVLEATTRPLQKVRISGGGRCNVTHHCFEPRQLVENYPRGKQELLGPFQRFQPKDLVRWFATRGVELKVEADGRMFPITDSSETIIDCFLKLVAIHRNIDIRLKEKVTKVTRNAENLFVLESSQTSLLADYLVLCTGSAPSGHTLAHNLGHSIIEPVPSLFTFKINHDLLTDLAGTSFDHVEARLQVETGKTETFMTQGPLLITHWGLSGPCVLKLSALAARALYHSNYQAALQINFMPMISPADITEQLLQFKTAHAKRKVRTTPLAGFSKRFWEKLLCVSQIAPDSTWQSLSKKNIVSVCDSIAKTKLQVNGKSPFKEEFVTAGGINKKEVDFKNMQSKLVERLFFAGEIIDIDAITGGFNFQNAWTGAWLVAEAISAAEI